MSETLDAQCRDLCRLGMAGIISERRWVWRDSVMYKFEYTAFCCSWRESYEIWTWTSGIGRG